MTNGPDSTQPVDPTEPIEEPTQPLDTTAGGTAASANTVTAQGAHPYPDEGNYTVTTTLSQGSAFSVIISSTATLADAPLAASSAWNGRAARARFCCC